jgi:hypothetical protein
MSDELKQIEIETARIKLERERLALEDELKKRERAEQAKETAVGVAHHLWSIKSALKVIAACTAAFILFALATS